MKHTYAFVLAIFDCATKWVGAIPVEILARSPKEAALTLGTVKHDPEWLKTIPALDIQDDEDLEGLIVGDFLLVKETITPPDRPESVGALQGDASPISDNDKHAHAEGTESNDAAR